MQHDHGLSDTGGGGRLQGLAEEDGDLSQLEELNGEGYLMEGSAQHLWSDVLRHSGERGGGGRGGEGRREEGEEGRGRGEEIGGEGGGGKWRKWRGRREIGEWGGRKREER